MQGMLWINAIGNVRSYFQLVQFESLFSLRYTGTFRGLIYLWEKVSNNSFIFNYFSYWLNVYFFFQWWTNYFQNNNFVIYLLLTMRFSELILSRNSNCGKSRRFSDSLLWLSLQTKTLEFQKYTTKLIIKIKKNRKLIVTFA